jgi:hypothetical protein
VARSAALGDYPDVGGCSRQGSWTGKAADQELGWLAEDEGYAEGPDPCLSSPSSLLSSNKTVLSVLQGSAISCIPQSWMLFQAGVD